MVYVHPKISVIFLNVPEAQTLDPKPVKPLPSEPLNS